MIGASVLALALAAAVAAPARAQWAEAADRSFAVQTPAGWTAGEARGSELLRLTGPRPQDGLTLLPGPAEALPEAGALSSLQALTRKIGKAGKVAFSPPRRLETPQPGRFVFSAAKVKGADYVVGFFAVDGKVLRVDAVGAGIEETVNLALSSWRTGPAVGTLGKKADRASPLDGRFSVPLPEGWTAKASEDPSEVRLFSEAGDEVALSAAPGISGVPQAGEAAERLAAALAKRWKLEFSQVREGDAGGRSMLFATGHETDALTDTALVGLFKGGEAWFRIVVRTRSKRPFDLAATRLEAFRLKGEESAAGPAAEKTPPPPPAEDVAAKIQSAPQAAEGDSQATGWLLMGLMAAVPVIGLAVFALRSRKDVPGT